MFVAAARDDVRAKLSKAAKEDKDTDADIYGKNEHAMDDNEDDDDEGGYLDFVDEVKKHVGWAEHMSSSVFLNFFTAILGGRVAWNESRQFSRARKGLEPANAAQALLDLEPGL